MTPREIWQRITTTRHTRAFEAYARLECTLREEIARERVENQRLRAENRALLNSILGIAGVPPLPVVVGPPFPAAAPPPPPDIGSLPPLASVGARHAVPAVASPEPSHVRSSGVPAVSSSIGEASPSNCAGRPPRRTAPLRESDARSSSPKQNGIAVPTRRRSWQQINRMLEFESTKKKESTVTS